MYYRWYVGFEYVAIIKVVYVSASTNTAIKGLSNTNSLQYRSSVLELRGGMFSNCGGGPIPSFLRVNVV